MTIYAGALLPLVVTTASGRAQANRVVQVLRRDRTPALLYRDRVRTPLVGPPRTDENGNLSDLFAEPGFYVVIGDGVLDVDTVAVGDPEEIVAQAGTREGPQGMPGTPGRVVRRFHGAGPPDVVLGAQNADEYVDTVSGDIYVLN